MTGDPGPDRISDAAYAAMVRARLEHEDGLIVSRLAWLMASESFLFTAYAIVLNGITTPGLSSFRQHQRLIQLIPVVGIASSVLIFAAMIAAIRAMAWLRGPYRARGIDEARLGLPPLRTPGSTVTMGLAAPVVLPSVFVATWLYFLVTRSS